MKTAGTMIAAYRTSVCWFERPRPISKAPVVCEREELAYRRRGHSRHRPTTTDTDTDTDTDVQMPAHIERHAHIEKRADTEVCLAMRASVIAPQISHQNVCHEAHEHIVHRKHLRTP